MATATLKNATRTTTSGASLALAAWMQAPYDASGEMDDDVRAEILCDASRFVRYGVQGRKVILKTFRGRTMLETIERQGIKLIIVDHVGGLHLRVRFWVNAASLGDLSAALKAAPDKRVAFDAIYEQD